MGPGNFVKDPISAISFGMALMFGTAGLPHILMRFFTVPSAKEARKSVMWATGWIGYFYLLTFIIGFGAITYVLTNPQFLDAKGGKLLGGGNMAAIHLANAVGGNCLPRLHLGRGVRDHPRGGRGPDALGRLGGLARPLRHGPQEGHGRQRLRVARLEDHDGRARHRGGRARASCSRSRTSPSWSSLAFAIAASANFPVLFMSVLWKDCTTRGCGDRRLSRADVVGRADGGVAVGVGSHAGLPEGLGAVSRTPRPRCSR